MRISDWSSDVCSSDLQIIAPEIDEARIELRRQFACVHCGVEIYVPAAERFGIMLAEMMRIAPIEALRPCKGAEAGIGEPHAARTKIRPDAIGTGCIVQENRTRGVWGKGGVRRVDYRGRRKNHKK